MLWKKKDIYVNRVKSIIFGMIKCILQTRTQWKGGNPKVEF